MLHERPAVLIARRAMNMARADEWRVALTALIPSRLATFHFSINLPTIAIHLNQVHINP